MSLFTISDKEKTALGNKNVCGHHGGLSTGPKTSEGIKRIQSTHWKHGNETKDARAGRSAKSLQFLMLEMIGWHVGLFAEGSTKFRGRKSNGFEKLDLDDPDDLMSAFLQTIKIPPG